MDTNFWSAFWPGFTGSLVSGALLLGAAYLFIDNRLHLRERSERRQEDELHRRQNRESVLRVVHGELESNAAQLTTALEEVPGGAILFPLFDVAMWPLITDSAVFTTLSNPTVTALTHAYNRMSTANEQNAFLSDLNHGPTAVLASVTISGSGDDDEVSQQLRMFRNFRDLTVRQGVLDRLRELKPRLDDAIDAVEHELAMTPALRAAQREYRSETRAASIGAPRVEPPEQQ